MSDANFQDAQNPYAAPYAEVGVKPEMAGPVASFRGYAGFWLRFVAFIIDYFFVLIVGTIISMLLGVVIGIIGAAAGASDSAQIVAIIVGYIFAVGFSIGYYAGMESSSYQATLGKMALGLKVVNLEGRRISFWRAFYRLILKNILGILTLTISYIMVGLTERKQGLYDMIAKTLVIKTR